MKKEGQILEKEHPFLKKKVNFLKLMPDLKKRT